MDSLNAVFNTFVDFVRVKHLNVVIPQWSISCQDLRYGKSMPCCPFFLAAILTLGYLLYQYSGLLFKWPVDEEFSSGMGSRSRSRSRTRGGKYDYKSDGKRRGRKHRCPDCCECNLNQDLE